MTSFIIFPPPRTPEAFLSNQLFQLSTLLNLISMYPKLILVVLFTFTSAQTPRTGMFSFPEGHQPIKHSPFRPMTEQEDCQQNHSCLSANQLSALSHLSCQPLNVFLFARERQRLNCQHQPMFLCLLTGENLSCFPNSSR